MKYTPRGPDSELEMHCLLRVSAKASGPQRKTPILVLWRKEKERKKRQFQILGCKILHNTWGYFLLTIGLREESSPHLCCCCCCCFSRNSWVQITLWQNCSALLGGVGGTGGYFKWQLMSLENGIQAGFMELSTTEKNDGEFVSLWASACPPSPLLHPEIRNKSALIIPTLPTAWSDFILLHFRDQSPASQGVVPD